MGILDGTGVEVGATVGARVGSGSGAEVESASCAVTRTPSLVGVGTRIVEE